jgi:hypothetical protein
MIEGIKKLFQKASPDNVLGSRKYFTRDPKAAIAEVDRLRKVSETLLKEKQELAEALEKERIQPAAMKAENAQLRSRITDLETELATVQKNTAHLASIKAFQITASQGQPPLMVRPTDTPAKPGRYAAEGRRGLDKAIACHEEERAIQSEQ